jgi:hypothetical protein
MPNGAPLIFDTGLGATKIAFPRVAPAGRDDIRKSAGPSIAPGALAAAEPAG